MPVFADNSCLIRGEELSLQPVLHGITLAVFRDKPLAITGYSGSGKTSLARILAGQLAPSSGVLHVVSGLKRLLVDQQDHFASLSGRRSTYVGQRYENQGMDSVPTVRQYLRSLTGSENDLEEAMDLLQIGPLAGSRLLQLSNGERKRTQLAATLLQKPDMLILDQPFAGLDVQARERLSALLKEQVEKGIALILICDPVDIPPYVDDVLELHREMPARITDRAGYSPAKSAEPEQPDESLFSLFPPPSEIHTNVVTMRQVRVTIGGKEILKDIDWQVKSGEQWALLGPNGAGKTTLLSLITADNPQGYANDLVLFDRERGSGETIWDIKKRIGFVSPELHRYFLRGEGIFNTIPGLRKKRNPRYDSLTCTDVICSGFRDEIGFASPSAGNQMKLAFAWLSLLRLDHLKDRLFVHASFGEQRSLLLARGLVKSPALLILDEPCQGLDRQQTGYFIHLLNAVCQRLHTTMIYVTHRREEIPACVTKLLQLENGRIKYCGSIPEDIIK